MKSPMIRPPILRRRSCRAISSAASRLVCRIVFSTSRPPLLRPGVHVDRDQRFGFVDHDIAAALQPDLAVKGVVDLLLDSEGLEDRRRPIVKLDAVARAPGNLAHHLVHALDRRAIVADDFVDFVGQEIADRPVDQIRFFENAAGRLLFLDRLFDPRPLLEQETRDRGRNIARAALRRRCE